MKEGWVYKQLGEIASTINGLWKGKKEPFVNVGVIRNANFTKDITLDFSKIEYLNVEERQYQKRKLQKGDLIVEKSGGSEKQPVGRTVLFNAEGEFSVSNFTSILRINNQNEITPEFLYKYLLYIYREGKTKEMQNAATGIHNIIFEKFLAISTPIPSLSDQQRIVSYLDAEFAKIEALKANAEKQLQAAKDLFQAALKELLTPKEGWEEKKIPEISDNLDNKRIPITQNKRESGIYPYYGASGIVDYVSNFIFDETLLLISEDGANLIARTTPIAFSVSGKIWVNNHAHVLRIKNDYLRKFVEFFFAKLNIKEYITGAAQPKLTQAALNKIPVTIPCNCEDIKKIVETLDALSANVKALQTNYTETITLCNDLKQALLKKVFE